MARKQATPVGLTAARRKKALAAYRRCGIFARVAEELGVSQRTLRDWRANHPDFGEEMDAIKQQQVFEMGQLAEQVVGMELKAYVDGVPVWHETDTKQGKVVRLLAARPYPHSAVKSALTKHDPDFVRVPLTREEQDKVKGFIDEVLSARGAEGPAPKADRKQEVPRAADGTYARKT